MTGGKYHGQSARPAAERHYPASWPSGLPHSFAATACSFPPQPEVEIKKVGQAHFQRHLHRTRYKRYNREKTGHSNHPPWKAWSGQRGSNSRPQAWEACALPTELHPHTTRYNIAYKTQKGTIVKPDEKLDVRPVQEFLTTNIVMPDGNHSTLVPYRSFSCSFYKKTICQRHLSRSSGLGMIINVKLTPF